MDLEGVTSSEPILGTDPLVADSDADGLLDGAEVDFHIDPLDPDSDGDGLLDGADPDPIGFVPFADGFESGDVSAWSSVT